MFIYLVRHGHTPYIDANILEPDDAQLDDAGVAQIDKVIQVLKDKEFDAMYVSPTTRTKQTAALILDSIRMPKLVHDALGEHKFGEFIGKSYAKFSAVAKKSGARPENYKPLGGESRIQVTQRVHRFLDWVLTQPHTRIIIVTHQCVIHDFIDYFAPFHKDTPPQIDCGSVFLIKTHKKEIVKKL
jgi:broad specificity phosphatase PhoE